MKRRAFAMCAAFLAVAPWAVHADDAKATIEYPTVAAAWKALHEKPGVQIDEIAGGTFIEVEPDGSDLWVFAAKNMPAYPAVLRRVAVATPDGDIRFEEAFLCEGTTAGCAQFRAGLSSE
ncbi:MAG TPA: hypothetical protein VFL14_04945 [Xanthomonadales bacterium]|nr:hypothetical protein [Xanthomonadales bacterium]